MEKSKWVWMPHAGHLIIGDQCKFHLTTYVGKYIVSTVGEWETEDACKRIHAEIYDPKWYAEHKDLKGDYFKAKYMKKFGYEEIGYGRKFESMVFKAVKAKDEYKCCIWRIESGSNIDFGGYNKAEDAFKGHMKLCLKWSKK